MPVYRIKGIKRVRNPKTGALYLYHRGTGKRLRHPEGTAAFIAEVAALDQDAATQAMEPRSEKGTWGWLRELYLASPKYAELAPKTRQGYRAILDYLGEPKPSWPGPATVGPTAATASGLCSSALCVIWSSGSGRQGGGPA